jgi:hypothetical protein
MRFFSAKTATFILAIRMSPCVGAVGRRPQCGMTRGTGLSARSGPLRHDELGHDMLGCSDGGERGSYAVSERGYRVPEAPSPVGRGGASAYTIHQDHRLANRSSHRVDHELSAGRSLCLQGDRVRLFDADRRHGARPCSTARHRRRRPCPRSGLSHSPTCSDCASGRSAGAGERRKGQPSPTRTPIGGPDP